jgi:hypothetical protein
MNANIIYVDVNTANGTAILDHRNSFTSPKLKELYVTGVWGGDLSSMVSGSSNLTTVDFSNLANRNNLDKAYKEIAISENFNSVFPSYSNFQGKFKLDPSTSFNNSALQYFYERLDLIKDLDYEDEPDKYEKICGIYENNGTSSYNNAFALGSIVIGNEQHRDDIGWFIGINHSISNIAGFATPTPTTGQYLNKIEVTNVIPMLRDDHSTFRTDLSNFNLIITLRICMEE